MPLVALLRHAQHRSIELSSRLAFNADDAAHVFVISLYGSLIDLTNSILTLIDAGACSGVPIILRTMLENRIELKLLIADPADHIPRMRLGLNKDWHNRLKSAAQGNPYLVQIAEDERFEENRQRHESALEQAREEKRRVERIAEKFHRAGHDQLYKSVYSVLSDHAHSSVGGLINRHLVRAPNGRINITYLRDFGPGEANLYASSAAELLIDGGVETHRFLTSGCDASMQGLQARFDIENDTYSAARSRFDE